MLKLVKPQHFLPVHGEYSFLCAHAEVNTFPVSAFGSGVRAHRKWGGENI